LVNIPYLRKKVSISLAFSAAILLLASPVLLLSNLLLQPVQAQTPVSFQTTTEPAADGGSNLSFRTTQPADGSLDCSRTEASLTFDGQGTAASDNQSATITSGTFQITSIRDGQKSASGSINGGEYVYNSGSLAIIGRIDLVQNFTEPCIPERGAQLAMISECSTSNINDISIMFTENGADFGTFHGAVECSQGGDTPSMTGSSQDRDSDGDGIPDSSDKCPHNSYHRCFKEAT
jgi:hypothetical protein